MKTIRKLVIPMALASIVAQPALAGVEVAGPTTDAVTAAFGGSDEMPASLAVMGDAEMASTRGRFAPLMGVVLGVAAVDIALMGFYWGVYVPRYASQGSSYRIP